MSKKNETATSAPANDKAAKAAAKKALAAGAKEIAKATAAAKKTEAKQTEFEVLDKSTPVPSAVGEQLEFTIVPSTRPVDEIIKERITMREGCVGLIIADELTPEEFVPVLSHYAGLQTHLGFIIGDLLAFGDSHFGNKYSAAIKATGLQYQTIANYMTTARKVLPEHRNPQLTYSHHAEVTKLPASKQDKLLAKAAKEKLSVSALREAVKAAAPATPQATKKDGQGASTTPAASTATTEPAKSTATTHEERKLTGEEAAENDAAIEKADELIDYLKGDTFKSLPKTHRRQWLAILKPFSTQFSELLAEFPGVK